MTNWMTRALLAALLATACAPASAQVVQRAPRVYRGLFGGAAVDPNRTRQEASISAVLFGTYDDNLAPVSSGLSDFFTPRPGGYSGLGDTRLRYWRGRANDFVEVTGGGALYSYQSLGISSEYAADAHAALNKSLGARYQVRALLDVRTDPFFALGSFSSVFPGAPQGVPVSATSPVGFTVRRSYTRAGGLTVARRFSRRNTIAVNYNYGHRRFDDQVGNGFSHAAGLSLDRVISSTTTVRGSYNYSDGTNVNTAGVRVPVDSQTANLGVVREARFSPTRRLLVSFGAGAVRVDTVNTTGFTPVDYWLPSGFLSIGLEWARSWSVGGDYARRVNVLEGLTVEPYTTDTTVMRLAGHLSPRVEMVANAGWANGQAAPGTGGRFDTYSGGTQLRFLVSRSWSMLVSHNFYAHRLDGLANLPAGISTRVNQHSLRVGALLDFALYGRYSDTARR